MYELSGVRGFAYKWYFKLYILVVVLKMDFSFIYLFFLQLSNLKKILKGMVDYYNEVCVIKKTYFQLLPAFYLLDHCT